MSASSRFDRHFWLITLSALLMVALTFSLGMWQLSRAAQKEQWGATRAKTQPIRLSGQWAAAQTLYVDNRQMQSKQGFFVVTPLITAKNEYVLVERGWIARDFMDRKKLQAIETPTGVVEIEIRRTSDPAPPVVFGKEAASEHPIVASIDLAALGKALPEMSYKGMAQQIGAPSEGLLRKWFEPSSGAEKNYGYAFQWFAMCAVLAGLYIWFQWLRPALKSKHERITT
jgi:surfeit locus 1 family protein